MTCRRKATSESSRLFLAILRKRLFAAKPSPWSRCCVNWNLKLELSCGLNGLNGASPTATRVLLKPTVILVPQEKPCVYRKLPVVVFDGDAGLNVLVGRMWKRSSCSVPVRIGSKLVIVDPIPSVDPTKPPAPAPAPPAPRVVPPVPEPTWPPSPPTPPPGVFCTMPVFTPRV